MPIAEGCVCVCIEVATPGAARQRLLLSNDERLPGKEYQ